MLQYIIFDVALHGFAILQYLYSDVALHSLHIFAMYTFKVFCDLGTGAVGNGNRARCTQFYSDPILFAFAGQACLRTGAAFGSISRAGRPGAMNSNNFRELCVQFVNTHD
jgi:hypothetical protein